MGNPFQDKSHENQAEPIPGWSLFSISGDSFCSTRREMTEISKMLLPDFLQRGKFAECWADTDEVVTIDSSFYKEDVSVNDQQQLNHLLRTLQFWIVNELPLPIVEFVLNNNSNETVCVLQQYANTLPYASPLLTILSASEKDRWFTALQMDCIVCAQYLFERNLHDNWDCSCLAASKAGSLQCLQYLHKLGCPWNEDTCEGASMNGHLHCLQYLFQQGCPWNESTPLACVAAGHTECLVFALKNNCPCDCAAAECAAKNGHLSALQAFKTYVCCTDYEWNGVMAVAAESGQLHCLRYLHEEGCLMNLLVLLLAARGGSVECLKYLHEIRRKWCRSVALMAASSGHLSCLQYAIEHGCPWDYSALQEAGTDEIIVYLLGLKVHNFVDNFSVRMSQL